MLVRTVIRDDRFFISVVKRRLSRFRLNRHNCYRAGTGWYVKGGVRDRKDTEDSVSFLYSGDMNSLLRTLSAGQVNDLTVTEPDLEEVFLHYYEKDGETI